MNSSEHPFRFVDCVELAEVSGRKAWDEQELLDQIEECPLESIYFHAYSYFLRHKYLIGPYPNDFATWAAIEVRDRVLGERLGILDPYDFDDLESFRGEIIKIIDDHLSKLREVPRVSFGEPFYFIRSNIIEVPTGLEASSLADLAQMLSRVDVGVIYYHFFEARRRGRKQSDFAIWLETLNRHETAHRIAALHPYMQSLEGLRSQIVEICREANV